MSTEWPNTETEAVWHHLTDHEGRNAIVRQWVSERPDEHQLAIWLRDGVEWPFDAFTPVPVPRPRPTDQERQILLYRGDCL